MAFKKELSPEAKQLFYYLKGVLVGFYPIEEPFKDHGELVFDIGILNDCFEQQKSIPAEDIVGPFTELSSVYQISLHPNDTISIGYSITTKEENGKYSFAIKKREGV
ncbi:hypothetical protein CIN_21440 [Commensalibacter intestini A911]|uniref:Uncharacterized protein n=1 Tax=Commensalibacter intestini A911 TaxID=1088868 RepID=G6F3E8_9PROT|nr:hypothetical protein [Commensalibacter intestini]EHD12898.1 hypothetical protein CIN_21440 [Commensalibacter intestini A911]